MKFRLPAWFLPPHFGDDEQDFTALLLHWSLLVLILVTGLLALNYLFISSWRTAFILGSSLVYGIGVFWLNRRGQTRLASILLVGALLVLVTLLATLNWGTRDEGVIVFPLIILIAAMVLPSQWYPAAVTLTLLAIAWLSIGEKQGHITALARPPLGAEALVTITIILLVEALLLRFITQTLKQNLVAARRSSAILEQQRIQLSESEERFRLLFEQSPEPLLLMDPAHMEQLIIVDCNPAFAALSGYRRTELIGQTINFLQRDGEPPRLRADNIARMRAGESLKGEVVHYTKASQPIRVQFTSTLVNISGRELILGAQHDVTEQRRIEEESRQLNAELEARVQQRTQQLEAAYRELESFSYTISHDLRAPLRGMVGFSQILLSEYSEALSPEIQDYLRRINTNSLQMGHLIDDLLDFLATGRRELRLVTVQPAKIARQAYDLLPLFQNERSIELVIHDMPSCQADPYLLEKVYTELFSNAIKFTRAQPAARIVVGAAPHSASGGVAYYVQDNGVGFDMAYASKIFGMFHRLHLPEEYEGTGVGLALVHRIITRHGGQVWAESALGEGAAFYFTLPEN